MDNMNWKGAHFRLEKCERASASLGFFTYRSRKFQISARSRAISRKKTEDKKIWTVKMLTMDQRSAGGGVTRAPRWFFFMPDPSKIDETSMLTQFLAQK